MGLLALGGAISGMGQGLQQGLHSMQTAIQQHGLQQEDRDFQMKKLQIQQDFESQREQRGYQHTEQMAKQNQDFLTTQKEGDHAATSAENEIKRTQDSIEKDKDRKLKEQELSIAKDAETHKSGYYDAYSDYLRNGGKNGAAASDKIDMETRKAGAAFYSSRIAPLEKQLIDPLTPEDQKQAISERIEELSKEGLGILGFTFGKDKKKSKGNVDDPFDGASPLSRKADAPAGDPTTDPDAPDAPKARGERTVNAAPAPQVGALEALQGGASEVGKGLINSLSPFSAAPSGEVTIEKRKKKE